MSRWAAMLCLSGVLVLAQEKTAPKKAEPAGQQEQEPPEEDQNLVQTKYSFNPLQASKEIQIGNFYFKKGSYRAAAERFRAATRWDQGNAEAWLRLAEASEKLKDPKATREAYQKYLALAPEAKNVAEIRKKLGKEK
jgi:Tfp pilus assembly protein PilF